MCRHDIKARAGPAPPPAQPLSGPSPSASVSSRPGRSPTPGGSPIVPPPFHPGGMPACSRWWSGAIPPDPAPQTPALRQECQPSLRLPLGARNPRIAKPTVCGRQNAHRQPKNSKNPRNNTFYALKQSWTHPTKCLPERPPAIPYRLLKPEAS